VSPSVLPPEPPGTPGGSPPAGPLARHTSLARLGHVLFWTVLFYLLTYGIAKLCEWLARL